MIQGVTICIFVIELNKIKIFMITSELLKNLIDDLKKEFNF
jgi:hypothetical protein